MGTVRFARAARGALLVEPPSEHSAAHLDGGFHLAPGDGGAHLRLAHWADHRDGERLAREGALVHLDAPLVHAAVRGDGAAGRQDHEVALSGGGCGGAAPSAVRRLQSCCQRFCQQNAHRNQQAGVDRLPFAVALARGVGLEGLLQRGDGVARLCRLVAAGERDIMLAVTAGRTAKGKRATQTPGAHYPTEPLMNCRASRMPKSGQLRMAACGPATQPAVQVKAGPQTSSTGGIVCAAGDDQQEGVVCCASFTSIAIATHIIIGIGAVNCGRKGASLSSADFQPKQGGRLRCAPVQ